MENKNLGDKWAKLKLLSELVREEENWKGEIASGEARALEGMMQFMTREIARDASEFLERNGFTRGGKKKTSRKIPGL